MWPNQSEVMFRTTNEFHNSPFTLTNYSSQMTHRKLKQVFNITYTHYCSTSIYKKLQDKCRQSTKKFYNKGVKDRKQNCFVVASEKKRSIFAESPLKLKFITLNNQQNKISKYQPKQMNKRTEAKNRYLFADRLQASEIYAEEQFPLKATGYKVQLHQKQDPKKHSRKALYRPSTAHPSLLKSKEDKRLKRLKTACDKHLQDSDMRTVVKGWQLTQRQH